MLSALVSTSIVCVRVYTPRLSELGQLSGYAEKDWVKTVGVQAEVLPSLAVSGTQTVVSVSGDVVVVVVAVAGS